MLYYLRQKVRILTEKMIAMANEKGSILKLGWMILESIYLFFLNGKNYISYENNHIQQ